MAGDGTIDLGVGKITPDMSPEEKAELWEKYWRENSSESEEESE